MEVLDHNDFDSSDILVGGQKSGKFKVMDDPHLMSMLSTNLYANPLRTMIQEICFNAWDAHRMGKCQDKPIDIYINSSSGLIIRDYGPGINPDQIDEIYCTYGASTKRNDETQTGGFGLGSKSPYAYNDNFTVTNFYGSKKSMFIMRRVHDGNNGGPGYDIVINSVPTEESGLLVTVPLKNERDMEQSFKYLKQILFLSGIKANIHYEDPSNYNKEDVSLVEADHLEAGEFVFDKEQSNGGIYAVYGGVKYLIPRKEEYKKEFDFIEKLSRNMGAFYIGFAPNSLTPMPNREGLNMREKSTESILQSLETIQEIFMNHIVPLTKSVLIQTLNALDVVPFDPIWKFNLWDRIETQSIANFIKEKEVNQIIEKMKKENSSQKENNIHNSIIHSVLHHTSMVSDLIGPERFLTYKAIVWAKKFPEHSLWRNALTEDYKGNKKERINLEQNEIWTKEILTLKKEIENLIDQSCDLRVRKNSNSQWDIVSNRRIVPHIDRFEYYKRDKMRKHLKDQENNKTSENIYRLWVKKSGEQIRDVMSFKKVIIAKTITALNSSEFYIQKILYPDHPNTYGYDNYYYDRWRLNSRFIPIPAFVVHSKKGNYDEVKEYLIKKGWDVIEADEPEPRKKKVVKNANEVIEPSGPTPYYRVNPFRSNWESEEEVEKPKTYVYMTQADINGYNPTYNGPFVKFMLNFDPNIVLVNNKSRISKIEKMGAIPLEDRVNLVLEKILANKERTEILAKHWLVRKESSIPEDILRIPEMQKIMKLPYYRSNQAENFERDLKFLSFFLEDIRTYRRVFNNFPIDLRDKVHKTFGEILNDDSVLLVRKMCKASLILDPDKAQIFISNMKPGEKKMFSQKLARFLRTI